MFHNKLYTIIELNWTNTGQLTDLNNDTFSSFYNLFCWYCEATLKQSLCTDISKNKSSAFKRMILLVHLTKCLSAQQI